MNIAVIDLGTNTFQLKIAAVGAHGVQTLFVDKAFVQIGAGGIQEGLLTADAQERALKAMHRFAEGIRRHAVDRVAATATSAIRSARNGHELLDRIKAETGIHIRVISGAEEAELIYYGVRSAMSLGTDTHLIMDIGGGSVEFVLCNEWEIFWKQSFEIGAQRLKDLFHHHEPIEEGSILALNEYLAERLVPLRHALVEFPPVTLVGSSGSFDTLRDIDAIRQGTWVLGEGRFNPAHYDLPISQAQAICVELMSLSLEARAEVPGMIPMRVEMIVVACALIQFVLGLHDFAHFRISNAALKEGLLWQTARQP